jgi:hypothetical protein
VDDLAQLRGVADDCRQVGRRLGGQTPGLGGMAVQRKHVLHEPVEVDRRQVRGGQRA